MKKKVLDIKSIAIASMLLATAFIASLIPLFKMPMGGEVTLLSMFFVTYIGYLYGPIVGLICAFIYGMLQFVYNPYILSPTQVIVDYFLAFTVLGLSGVMRNKKNGLQIGYTIGILARLIFATLSGFLFFNSYASRYNMTPLIYSLCYNSLYIIPEAIITLVIISLPPINKLCCLKKHSS